MGFVGASRCSHLKLALVFCRHFYNFVMSLLLLLLAAASALVVVAAVFSLTAIGGFICCSSFCNHSCCSSVSDGVLVNVVIFKFQTVLCF